MDSITLPITVMELLFLIQKILTEGIVLTIINYFLYKTQVCYHMDQGSYSMEIIIKNNNHFNRLELMQ